MVQLRHPNIVLYMAACMEPNKLCIISELMFRGSLHDVLHDETTNLELPLRVSFLTDAAKGLQYLHLSSPPILHRDLKSPNLLLDEKMNVKISDFGLTGIQAKRGKGEEPPGTLLWMAPEVILGLDYTDKSDIYSFGIIMWEVLTRMDPYEGEEIAESVALRVAENNLRPEIPSDDSIPQELISLMSLCWDQEQEKRPSFTNVLKKMGMATDSSQSSMSFSMNIEATSSFKSQGSNARTKKQKAPLGTIALVFTDVQSSTSLWEKFHGDMATSLTIHNDIMRGCIRRNEGYEVRTEGDAFMVAFTSVKNAVMYCLQAQELLLSAEWPPGIFEHPAASIEGLGDKILFKGIRVRMGIHWCEPLYREDPMTQRIEYFGKPVIHANRVGDFPSGGQIVLSESAYEQIQNDLDDIGPPLIKDLGSQKLKGLEAEERLYEVTPRSISERSDYFSSHSREETFTKHSFTSETEGRDNGPSAKIFSWQINIDALTITKDDLGSGSFGTVYKGVYNGEEVAVKVLARQKLSEKQQFSLLSEISIMLNLKHPNILGFIGANMKAPKICFVTEYAPGGNLKTLLDNRKVPFDENSRRQVLIQVASAMNHLHTQNPVLCHRDLKSLNILIFSTEPMLVKLCDFGLARVRAENQTMTKCGTKAWLAPEVLKGLRYTEKADVYSFAILIWECITRQTPYSNIDSLRLTFEVVKGLRPTVPKTGDAKMIRLMEDCWNGDPEKRPSFGKVLQDLGQ